MESLHLELIEKSIKSQFGQNPLKNLNREQVENLCSKVKAGETVTFFEDKKRTFLGVWLFVLFCWIPPIILINAPVISIGLSIFPSIALIYLLFQLPFYVNKIEISKKGLIKYGIFHQKYYSWEKIRTLEMTYTKGDLPLLHFYKTKEEIPSYYFKEYTTETVFGTLILLSAFYSQNSEKE